MAAERSIKITGIKLQLMCHDLMALMVSRMTTANGCQRHGNPRATHRLICMKNQAVYREPLYMFVYINTMLATLTHICIIATPFARSHSHTHTPPCVGLNENGACWPNERELFTYAVSMCGSWEGRAVSIYTTYADPIKAREGSKKQTTNNF